MTVGRRVYVDADGQLPLLAGDYGKAADGIWKARPPALEDQHPLSGSLAGHEVVEHEDGTITASPSILIEYPWGPGHRKQVRWHGYLERGVWRVLSDSSIRTAQH